MTTRQFIADTIGSESNRVRQCSSVFTDQYGKVYSYGYHYPLAVVLGQYGFVNTRGYSNTTSRHISWAFSALWSRGLKVIGIPLTNGNGLTVHDIKESAQRELHRVSREMTAKKRTNTQVYQDLARRKAEMFEALHVLNTF